MDVMMPIMNGLDALDAVKADEATKHIPVIMMSAHEDDNLLTRAMRSGASCYIVKSNIEVTDLVPILTATIEKAHRQQ
ncbi:response regulator [Polaromonas sp.]|nr:response regulator [Candidatus Saccharibacteria bacterium]